ncbi:MAG: pirin family protein [Alphaproteobacteria bacterium]|nr:pirin family protein [Alphaproteobacteria bacterium]
MIAVRPAAQRGHADHGWLDSHHTFSFASYHDPRHMGFSDLRVINEDRVAPGAGFGRHPHRDMEIVSYVVSGALSHQDTLGNGSTIRPGEVQRMSAGTGLFHSEMNGSKTEPVHFLQIWLLPDRAGRTPGYAQRDFGLEPGLRLVASPDGREGSLDLGQDTDLWRALLPEGEAATVSLRHRRAWVQVVRGELEVAGTTLGPGDGAALHDVTELPLRATTEVEALIFDLR